MALADMACPLVLHHGPPLCAGWGWGGGSRGGEGVRGEGPGGGGAGQGGGREGPDAASIPAIPLSAAGSTSLLTLSTLSKWAAALSVASGPQPPPYTGGLQVAP